MGAPSPCIEFARRLLAVAIAAVVGSAAIAFAGAKARAQDAIKIGLSAPLTGPSAENGEQMIAAAKLFMEQNGTTIVGRQIQLIIRDDGGVPDQARRIAQEFVVNDKVAILAGHNPTPNALAVAPIATEAKIPEIVVGAVASIVTARSPYIVRTMYAQTQVTVPMAQWAKERSSGSSPWCLTMPLVWMPRRPSLTNSRPMAGKSWRRYGTVAKPRLCPLPSAGA